MSDVGVGCWCRMLVTENMEMPLTGVFQLLGTDFNIFDINGFMSPKSESCHQHSMSRLLVININSNSPRTFEFLIVHGSCTILSDKVLASSLAL